MTALLADLAECADAFPNSAGGAGSTAAALTAPSESYG
jgi:hypothetical protein